MFGNHSSFRRVCESFSSSDCSGSLLRLINPRTVVSIIISSMVYQNWNVPSHPASYATPPPRQPKRRKIAVACEECRARKVRCDGQRPGNLNPYCIIIRTNRVNLVCGPCLNKAEHHGVNANCLYSEKSSDRSGDRGRE